MTPRGPAPLSGRQSLLWLDEQLHPTARWHGQLLTVELDGELEVARLARAWADTVRAHDAFALVVDGASDRQTFLDEPPAELPVVEVGPDGVAGWLAERAARPLAGPGPRFEAALLRASPARHVFCLRQHQLGADATSLLLLAAELGERFEGRAPGPAPSFAAWLDAEAAYRASPQAREDQAHWSRVLLAEAPPLRPYGLTRADRSAALTRCWLVGGPARAARLEAAAASEPFRLADPAASRLAVLATALAAFLHRVTGDRELLLGLPWPDRPAGQARAVGPLLGQLFLRVEVVPGEPLAALGARVRSALAEALRHARASAGDRGLEYATLTLLPPLPRTFGGRSARVALTPATALAGEGAGRGDLRDTLGVVVHAGDGALDVAFDLHRATFGGPWPQRVRAHFTRVLDAVLEGAGAAVDVVDLLDDEGRRAVLLLAAGADPVGDAPDLLDQLAAQVARRGGRPAVEADDGRLSYAELDARTNQLARRLRQLGVARESRVGVAVPRGARELATLLATLKAGGAYVPVDPSHPVERVRVILEDAAPEVLVAPSGSPLLAAMPPGTRHLALDDLDAATAGLDAASLGERGAPGQLAYILFTSGSTGRPKGVEVLRGAFANFLRSMAHTPGLGEQDRVLAVTTTTFDIAGLELFLPLWVGATTCIADKETAVDPQRLRARLEQGSFTLFQATPATWRLLVEAGWKGDGRLRMLCGGEALSPELAARLLALGGELWNVYGPTETTVWSTLDRVRPGERITIGRPIDRTQVYLLDPALQLLPPGVVGELFIGGDGLARGYRGRPDLTAERFLPDPHGKPGARLYRTGDLGRLLEDGRLECLGRVDHQVKIRGFRIELGEIESALRAVPGVREVVVVADADGGGEPRLLASWVGTPERAALVEQARRKLPPYMVPTAWQRLVAFPLTTSGKIDRKALPRPEREVSAPSGLVRPRDDLEARIAATWSELLGVVAVGIDQDFFALGGTSVLAIQARARLERELGVELPLRAFFEHPTVEGLARQVGRPASEDGPIVVKLRQGRDGVPPLFLLAGVRLYQDLALALDGERPVFGLHVPIRWAPGREPRPGVPDIAARYLELVRGRQPHGPYHLGGLCFGGVIAYEVARQLEAQGQAVEVVALFDAYMPGAERIRQAERLRGYLRRGLRDPAAAVRWVGRRAGRLAARARRRLGLEDQAAGADAAGRLEIMVDGEAADEIALRYGTGSGPVAAHLLVFRAVARDLPPWVELATDLGWSGRSARVTCRDVACDHLDIVRGAHAEVVAGTIGEALRPGPPGAQGSG
jgi:amino acid adenylation domain-containing protein